MYRKKKSLLLGVFFLLVLIPSVAAEINVFGKIQEIVTGYDSYKEVYNFIFYFIVFLSAFTIGARKASDSLNWGDNSKSAVTALALILALGSTFGVNSVLKNLAGGPYYALDFLGRFALIFLIFLIVLLVTFFYKKNDAGAQAMPYLIAGGIIILYYLLQALFTEGAGFPENLGESLSFLVDSAFYLAYFYLLFLLINFLLDLLSKVPDERIGRGAGWLGSRLGNLGDRRPKWKWGSDEGGGTPPPENPADAAAEAEAVVEAVDAVEEVAERVDDFEEQLKDTCKNVEKVAETNPKQAAEHLNHAKDIIDAEVEEVKDVKKKIKKIYGEVAALPMPQEEKVKVIDLMKKTESGLTIWGSNRTNLRKATEAAGRSPTIDDIRNIMNYLDDQNTKFLKLLQLAQLKSLVQGGVREFKLLENTLITAEKSKKAEESFIIHSLEEIKEAYEGIERVGADLKALGKGNIGHEKFKEASSEAKDILIEEALSEVKKLLEEPLKRARWEVVRVARTARRNKNPQQQKIAGIAFAIRNEAREAVNGSKNSVAMVEIMLKQLRNTKKKGTEEYRGDYLNSAVASLVGLRNRIKGIYDHLNALLDIIQKT